VCEFKLSADPTMFVIKRDASRERVSFEQITARIAALANGLDVDCAVVSQKVIVGVVDGITTAELDTLAAETAASLNVCHPDYGTLAARIEVSNLHKMTHDDIAEVMGILRQNVNSMTKERSPMVTDEIFDIVQANRVRLNSAIDHRRDYDFDYFGIKTLIKSYLFAVDGVVVERPQQMLLRVALGIHGEDIEAAIESYDLMSRGYLTHATPTLFNAGTPRPQMSSCFLLQIKEDSVEGVLDTLKQCAVISKYAGGIGLSVSKIRARGSFVRGSRGESNGIIPMLRVFNDTARFVDQGGGKRKGSFAVYLEPWHLDIFDFLSLRKNTGKPEERARDLFTALWVPDLFMERVVADREWSLFCPDTARGLCEVWGSEFNALYERYEAEGKHRRQIKARELWRAIISAQIESGGPFICYKDHSNAKSNQQHLGTLQSANLCTEIVEYTASDEIAVCNLASIALPKFVSGGTFDFQRLMAVTAVVTRNLNKIIDRNFYPLEECKNSNLRHRPIGIGVQGLADVFIALRLPFDSEAARAINKEIFEAIYFSAVTTSNELARRDGAYPSFEGSPASKGLFQFDLWRRCDPKGVAAVGTKYDWDSLRAKVMAHGLRNSLLTAPMPTASTSQILGNNECFEPYTSNVYVRRTLAGEFVVINSHLMRDLIARGLWSEETKQRLIADNGSVQRLEIPEELKLLYRSVWEIPQKAIVEMAADRGPFVDQSQSLNIHLADPNYAKMTSMHFWGWRRGLKTGMYYLRTRAAVDAIKVTVPELQIAALRRSPLEPAVAAPAQKKEAAQSEEAAEEKRPSPLAFQFKAKDVRHFMDKIAREKGSGTTATTAEQRRRRRKAAKARSAQFDDDEKDGDVATEQSNECLMCGS